MRFPLATLAALALTTPAPAQKPADLLADKTAARILIPAYIFPSLDTSAPAGLAAWDAVMKAAGPRCPVVAILNPANGPLDPNDKPGEPWRVRCYSALLADAAKRAPHLKFVMYVPLAARKTAKFDGRDEWQVRAGATADVDAWLATYPPKRFPNLVGFFLDEHPAVDPAQLKAAVAVREYAEKKFPGSLRFLNVGQVTDAAVLTRDRANEVAILWEKAGAANFAANFALPGWAAGKGKDSFAAPRFAALVHTEPKLARDFVADAVGKGVGWVYATDKAGWSELPAYWGELAEQVRLANGAKPTK